MAEKFESSYFFMFVNNMSVNSFKNMHIKFWVKRIHYDY